MATWRFSLFEPHTELIKRGKRQKLVEFGHKVLLEWTTKMCQRDAGGNTLPEVEHLSQICAMQVAESPAQT